MTFGPAASSSDHKGLRALSLERFGNLSGLAGLRVGLFAWRLGPRDSAARPLVYWLEYRGTGTSREAPTKSVTAGIGS